MLRRFTKAEQLFSQGQMLITQQHYDAAVEVLRRALSLRPQAVGTALHLALALAESGQMAAAMDTIHTAMTWQPHHPVLPLFLAQLCVDATDYAQARHWCDHTLTLTPHNPYAHGLQALVDMALGHVPQAYARLKQPAPLPIGPAERLALRLTQCHPPTLLHLANTALNSRLLLYAESYLCRQDAPVRSLSQQLLALSPPMLASRCLARLDRLCTRSVMGLQRLALDLRLPAQPAAQALRRRQIAAEEAYYLGDVATARRLYSALLSDLPDPDTARQRLCEVCYEQGDFTAALEALRSLMGDAARLDAWQAGLLGELLAVAGHYTAAASALQQAVQQGLQDFKLFYYLGLCQVHQGVHPQARRSFARAVQLLNPGITALRLDEMYRVYTHAASPPQPCPAE